jgi:hypothetical protein
MEESMWNNRVNTTQNQQGLKEQEVENIHRFAALENIRNTYAELIAAGLRFDAAEARALEQGVDSVDIHNTCDRVSKMLRHTLDIPDSA